MYVFKERTIDFSWETEQLRRQVETATSCYAGVRGGETDSGESLILSSDERVLFGRLLSEAMRALYAYFIKMAAVNESSFAVDEPSDDGVRECGFSVERKRRVRELSPERIAMVDRCASEFLVCHITTAWFEMSVQPEGAALFAGRLKRAQTMLLRSLAYLCEYSYSKSYTVIDR
ncbi:MAG: hypothetical protein K2L01_04100 [Rikenellaceae bacterium]|nr:hypothetical protein [Rikenellaceae bacterium]